MKTRNELRAIVDQLKTSTCMDCLKEGITKVWPPEAMQFDHVPERGPKVAEITALVRSRDEDALMKEIAKCDIICAGHHEIRTKARGKSLETRARMSAAQKISQNRPEVKAKVKKAVSERWQMMSPEQRQHKLRGLRQSHQQSEP